MNINITEDKKNEIDMKEQSLEAIETFCLDMSPINSTTLHTYTKQY